MGDSSTYILGDGYQPEGEEIMKKEDKFCPHSKMLDLYIKKISSDSLVVMTTSSVHKLTDALTQYSLRSGKKENFDSVIENLAKAEIAINLLKRKFQSEDYDNIVDDEIGKLYKELINI